MLWCGRGLCELLSSDLSPLSSLFDNPAFPQGIGAHALGSFLRTSWPQAHTFIHADSGTPNSPTGTQDWLTSLHLTTFTKHLFSSSQTHRPLTEFEHLGSLQELPRQLPRFKPSHKQTYPLTLGCGRHTWEGPSPERNGKLHSISHTSPQSLVTRKRRILRCRDGTGTTLLCGKYSPPLHLPAGDVMQPWARTFMSGGSVIGSDPSGNRYSRYMKKSMMTLCNRLTK